MLVDYVYMNTNDDHHLMFLITRSVIKERESKNIKLHLDKGKAARIVDSLSISSSQGTKIMVERGSRQKNKCKASYRPSFLFEIEGIRDRESPLFFMSKNN